MKEVQAPKTVQISDEAFVRTTIVDTLPEVEATWFTGLEIANMQLKTYRESLRLSRLMLMPGPFTSDQKLQCLGIESLIVPVPAMVQAARQERRNHVRLILRAQQFYTDKELSVLSSQNSASACQRAYLLANRDFE